MKPLDALPDDDLLRLAGRAAAQPDAPAAWIRAAIAALPATRPGRLQRWLATLTFDSAATSTLALGLRGSRSATRHLLFSAMGRDIDLRIAPDGAAFAISGQILGPDLDARVELAAEAGSAVARETALDAMGEFRLDAVGPGRYRLMLRTAEDEIELPAIDVGTPPG